MIASLPEEQPGRPLWLVTLADLALLLLGFFVLVQASGQDRKALASGFRAGFGVEAKSEGETPPRGAMPVGLSRITGFAPGAAALPDDAANAVTWAQGWARDPRTRVTITGETDGSASDVDAATGSAALLAADRARTVAALLVRLRAVAPDRIAIATNESGKRQVVLTLGFAGNRQALAGRQPAIAGAAATQTNHGQRP